MLFGITGSGVRLPREFFGVLWWVLGVWLFKSLLDLVLLRTFSLTMTSLMRGVCLPIWPPA